VKRRAYELLGDAFRVCNDIAAARDAYEKAGAVRKLREIGAEVVANRLERRKAPQASEQTPDATLAARGDALAVAGKLKEAIAAYRTAGAHEKLIELGDRCAQSEMPRLRFLALEAYRGAGDTTRMIDLGDRAAAEGQFALAMNSFDAAHHVIRLERLGDSLMQLGDDLGNLEIAAEAFARARIREKLLQVGNRFVTLGAIEKAMVVFRKAARFEISE
jgi:tetratricopeptide (TPR) repeat protein